MTVQIVRMSADSFRLFRQENRVVTYDESKGIAWFDEDEGKVRCVDRVSLWNTGAGGVDDVLMVVADTAAEAARELERVRPRCAGRPAQR